MGSPAARAKATDARTSLVLDAPQDDGRVAVDAVVPDAPSRVVPLGAGKDDLAAKSGGDGWMLCGRHAPGHYGRRAGPRYPSVLGCPVGCRAPTLLA